MSKKSIVVRGLKRDFLIAKYSGQRKLLSSVLRGDISFQERLLMSKKLQALPRSSAPSRHRNRCWVTGRSRSFYRDFGVCRHSLREMAHDGVIPGLVKSSW
jgi:small subunit ribosomal protein S14